MSNRDELTLMGNRELAELLLNSGGGCDFCKVNEDDPICERETANCIKNIVEWLESEARG